MPSKEKSCDAAYAAVRLSRETIAPHLVEKCNETWQDSTIDLLTSLRHLADKEGFDFSNAVASSQILYDEEIAGTDGEGDDEEDDA